MRTVGFLEPVLEAVEYTDGEFLLHISRNYRMLSKAL